VTGQTEQQRLEQVRAMAIRGDFAGAEAALGKALSEFPRSFELQRVLAGLHQRAGREREAESLLRALLGERPHDAGSAFALAQLLIGQGRTSAAGQTLRHCFEGAGHDANLAIRAIEMLDDADCKADAATVAECAVTAAPDDPRLHAYAGMLALQLGRFECAREHCLFALAHSPQACEWQVPHGLAQAQHYTDATHQDFASFKECLQRTDLSGRARSGLLFALGKAYDDIGDHASAAAHFREANALAHSLTQWSRKDWRRTVEARLASAPLTRHATATDDFIPVFVIGMPRSGTTLLAELLSRCAGVCNRGELPWIAKLAQRADLNGNPSEEMLERAAEFYIAQTRRDDAPAARWFVDKQPLNFRYVDLMLALFPNARIIQCTRSARDTALSLWTQSFREDVQGYAYDFNDIAVVMRDCERLMAHWQRRFPQAIRAIGYEQLVARPEEMLDGMIDWLGLPTPAPPTAEQRMSSISTASLWQARQPVYSGSVRRWRAYAPFVPELLQFADA
jgi:tetratricopeptide (TPR) repeat protein